MGDYFLPAPPELPRAPVPPASLEDALAGKVLLAGWHQAEVEHLVIERQVDLVLADGFRLGAGLAAERLGVPWLAYTHHYFDEAGTSEGMVEYYCQRFGRAEMAAEVFQAWWPDLLEALGASSGPLDSAVSCWWNLSGDATVVLGLPELKVHQRPALAQVHRVGPTLWRPAEAALPEGLSRLGQDRPAVLVALSSNPVGDEDLVQVAGALSEEHDVVVTSGPRQLRSVPPGVLMSGDLPHGPLVERMAAVVCSAGHGAVTRAACAGVPVVAVPRMGDQFLVADAVEATGLGWRMEPDQGWDAITAAVAEILESDLPGPKNLRAASTGYSAVEETVRLVEELRR